MLVERRSGTGRRRRGSFVPDVLVACRRIRDALVEWTREHGGTDVARIISDEERILEAHWEMWKHVLGYDIREIHKAEDLYISPEERQQIRDEVRRDGSARRVARIIRADGTVLRIDIFMIQKKARYHSFIKILE
ncbi:hypothetical protein OOT00_15925 [Desulfobotulus sp. H1]|uniref:Uncharacterized protein n=1 Tax=Desulfobotulus pelophilus TaxID=2823377 RepID=A0ABT3NDC2_9BACT|nr:hypothetical protein [Desulfobotulus pelophilus]MCW7755464.1 hypothetical protein [Desulfobotulus pelophilus]